MALSRKIKGVTHYAYESELEFRTAHPKEKLIKDWREAKQGEWCLADDGKIVQILLKNTMKGNKIKEKYIRTVIGMITVRKSTTLVGDITDSLYRFVKRHSYDSRLHGGMTKQKKIFLQKK